MKRPGMTGANVNAGLRVFAAALLALAVFRSADVVSRAYDLPEGAFTETLVSAATAWNGWMEEAGIVQLSEDITRSVEDFTQRPFGATDGEPDDVEPEP